MSVRASERKTSDLEYENTYTKLYRYVEHKARKIPKRHMSRIGVPVMSLMNEIYEDISTATDLYNKGKCFSAERLHQFENILKKMDRLRGLTYIWWLTSLNRKNEVPYIKVKQRRYWAELFNTELKLIYGIMRKCNKFKEGEYDLPFMEPIGIYDVQKAVFLQKLYELNKIVYKCNIRCGKDFKDARMEYLSKLTHDALYSALKGNKTLNTNEKDLKKRTKYFSDAISKLYAMDRPVRELEFDLMFSEDEIREICNLITDSKKILQSINNNEKEKLRTLQEQNRS